MKRYPIFVAVDTVSVERAKSIIDATVNYVIGYKFGLEFFSSNKGRQAIKKFINGKIKIFLDLKLKDIPNTVYKTVLGLKDLKIDYLTVHASGGYEMLKAAKKAQEETNKRLKLLAVTVLTSLTNNDLKAMGNNTTIQNHVQKLALLSKKAKIHGIVCSAHEIKTVRKINKRFEIVVPGIRVNKKKSEDQKRVMSPVQAINTGANYLVIGRDITKGNIRNNIHKVLQFIK